MKKIISVIIPNYNNSCYLKRCINSLENQTHKELEVIFVDDGSTDDSLNVIKKLKKESNLNLIIIEQYNQNASIARNRGIEIATGEYMFFLDSDDYLSNDKALEHLLKPYQNYKVDLVIGNYNIVNETKGTNYEYIVSEHINNNEGKYKYTDISPVPSNKLYRADIIKKNNIYFSNVRIGQDLNFFLKYLLYANKVEYVNHYIYNYQMLESGMTKKNNLNFMDIYVSINEIKKEYNKNKLKFEFTEKVLPTCIKHITNQISRLATMNNRNCKKMLIRYFNFCIYELTKDINTKNKLLKSVIRNYKIKVILVKFNLYNLYKKYLQKNEFNKIRQ